MLENPIINCIMIVVVGFAIWMGILLFNFFINSKAVSQMYDECKLKKKQASIQ